MGMERRSILAGVLAALGSRTSAQNDESRYLTITNVPRYLTITNVPAPKTSCRVHGELKRFEAHLAIEDDDGKPRPYCLRCVGDFLDATIGRLEIKE